MTRISIYNKDTDVRGNDKWIGSDAQNQNRTKNFTPDNVATYFNENQVIDLGVELRYFYDTLDPLQQRVFGSITFETEIGPQVNFSAISTFILSKYTMGHTDVSQFLDFLIGSNVILSRANNINMFGYYKIGNIEPYLPDPNFFVVTLTFENGNGFMKEDEDYFISLIQFEQTIPEVPTKTSDLINDGEDGVHPFITAEDVTTPTLQSVTDEGNTTTTVVHLDGGALSDSVNEQALFNPDQIATVNKNTGSGAALDSQGNVSISRDGIASGLLTTDNIINDVTLQFPNKSVGSYTIATTEDFTIPTLQSVTDQGSTTTNSITVDSANYFSIVEPSDVGTENKNTGSYAYLSGDGILGLKNTMFESDLKNTNVTHAGIVLEFPDKTTGSYTIATTSDIPVVTGFVPYIGATGNIDIGSHNYIGGNITLNGTISGDGGTLNLLQGATNTIQGDGYSSIYSLGTDSIGFYLANGSDSKQFNFLADGITLNDTLDYTLPSLSGTIAITSDIPTKTSDLTNDGSDGIHPFITAADVPTNGLPTGGTAGQILTKVDATDYNATWQENFADWTSQVKHIVKNNGLSGTITKGTAVYVTGSNGTNMLVGRASNASEATSSKTMGLMQSDITTTGGNQTGFVITEGLLQGLNTSSATAGDPVWLGVNGALIYGLTNKPYAPAHLVFIGIVTKISAGNGEIFVKVQNGFELKEIHDVDIITTTPINGHLLGFDGTLWVNKTIATWLGFTPVTNARTISTTAPLSGGGDLSVNRTLSITQATTSTNGYLSSTDWNTFNGKGNGTVTSVSALTLGTTGTDLSSSVATGTTTPVITLNVPTASATNRGVLSSTDWTTFNGKFTLPALTSGSILFSNGTTISQNNSNFFWDNTNNRLGIGTNAPNSTFHLASSITAASAIARGGNITSTLVAAANSDVLVGLEINPTFTLGAFTSVNSVGLLLRNGKLQVLNGWTGNNPYADVASFGNPVGQNQFISVDSVANSQAGIIFRSQLGNRWTQYREATNSNMIFLNASTAASALTLFYSSSNIGINTTTDAGYKLDVNGTARFNNSVIAQTVSSVNVLDIGSVRIADDGNQRYIQAVNGVALRATGTPTTNILTVTSATGNTWKSTQTISLNPNSGFGGVLFSSTNIAGPSNTILTFVRQRNDAAKSAIINTEDFASSGNTPVNIFIYAGKETVLNNQANLILSHDGTNARGNTLIGTSTNVASAIVNVESTTQGFLPPRMTTTQKNAIATPAAGLVVYDTTLGKLCVRGAAAWETITSI